MDVANQNRDQYFRLNQVDFDGTSTIYDPVYLNCEIAASYLTVYYSNNQLNILLPSDFSNGKIEVLDISGKIINVNDLLNGLVSKSSVSQIPVQLSSGLYIINATNYANGKIYSAKMSVLQ